MKRKKKSNKIGKHAVEKLLSAYSCVIVTNEAYV